VFVCILPEKAIPKMTYTVSGGTLNPTHSLTQCSMLFESYHGSFASNLEQVIKLLCFRVNLTSYPQ